MQTYAATSEWWQRQTPKQRRQWLVDHPHSKYGMPPHSISPHHTTAVIKDTQRRFGRAVNHKQEPSSADYDHHKTNITVRDQHIVPAIEHIHRQLKQLGYTKKRTPNSHHFIHPTSRNVVNVTVKPSKHPKHARLQIRHIHPAVPTPEQRKPVLQTVPIKSNSDEDSDERYYTLLKSVDHDVADNLKLFDQPTDKLAPPADLVKQVVGRRKPGST